MSTMLFSRHCERSAAIHALSGLLRRKLLAMTVMEDEA